MYKILYPDKDATLYEKYPDQNTGVDQILEITKITAGAPVKGTSGIEYWDKNYNSRILIKFDLSDVSQSISNGTISPNANFYIRLKPTDATNIPIEHSIFVHLLSGSWSNGTGYYNNNPKITDGVSWSYRHSKTSNTYWQTSSFSNNTTSSYSSFPGGGVWYTGSGYESYQHFNYEIPEIRIDVSDLVKTILSGSVENNGFIIKRSDSDEINNSVLGTLKFFSKDSHTVFLPKMEIFWDDSNFSGTSSYQEIADDDFIIHIKNLMESYYQDENPRLRLSCRERYPLLNYSNQSAYLQNKRLPTSSYFAVMDYLTNDFVVPFDYAGTKISCDSKGNYINMNIESIMPERYYRLVFKCEFEGGKISKIIDDNYVFKIRRMK
jgi:hypothetical protein